MYLHTMMQTRDSQQNNIFSC